MRSLIVAVVCLLSLSVPAQKTKVPPKNYPSLLWEITGKGLSKPSYLFGTMHVSSKLVFHLSDSFYLAIRNSDVVALETNMGTWQEDFSRYDLAEGMGLYRQRGGEPEDYMTIGTLQYPAYDKKIEQALYASPSMINNFLYRSNSERSSDFEEDTYLDMHIYQTGKKWGKKVCGVESFDRSMQLMKEAYEDAAKAKDKRDRNFDEDFSYENLETAYRTGNLDLLDTINKVNSNSAAFDEKFIYLRNSIQAHSIDSIIRTRAALFVGVGAAHLPGRRGVIELLRDMGYRLRPIMMTERDSRHKDEVEKIRVPVTFSRQSAADGFFSVSLPGKLYDFSRSTGSGDQQFADMTNGSYYTVSRINTNALIWGHSEDDVLRKLDSLIYENVPGKIIAKKAITRNGYKGYEVTNRTRRGDFQRYNIFATPFEIIVFKMSGNGDYVKNGTEANQFFNSIQLRSYGTSWTRWSPATGGFSVELPHAPVVLHDDSWQFMAQDKTTGAGLAVIRTDLHNYGFAEEDSFDLDLMEESFASSDFIARQLNRRQGRQDGYATLDATYKYKDSSVAQVRFLVQGPHYYTLVAHGRNAGPRMQQFIQSFRLTPYTYGPAVQQRDTSMYFTVSSPVPLMPAHKISMMPDISRYDDDDESVLQDRLTALGRLVSNDSTGEKIYVSFSRNARYYYDDDTVDRQTDTTHFRTPKENWVYRQRKIYTQPNGVRVFDYVLGDPKSSRYVHGRLFSKGGVDLRLESEGDTLTKPSSFLSNFYNTFQPDDTLTGPDARTKKSAVFFADFFSADSIAHRRAVSNLETVRFDSSDFGQIKKGLSSLSWSDKKYIDTKKAFIMQMGSFSSRAAVDYLAELYRSAGDTVEIQYAVLSSLLNQETAYAYDAFRNIMVNDPPVLDLPQDDSYRSIRTTLRQISGKTYTRYRSLLFGRSFDGGGFMNKLLDSLQLTGRIFRDLLPLINLHDYEQPMMTIMGVLADSSIITAKDYEVYQSKFLIEARQLWKKQMILEKGASIKKAQQAGDDKDDDESPYYRKPQDEGNTQLSLYATLLMPFWNRTVAVPQLVYQFLLSNDSRLRFNTAMLLLQYGKPLPDTLLRHFASSDEYRYELYTKLRQSKKLNLFPAAYNNPIELGKSKLLSVAGAYQKPDTLVFLDRLELRTGDSAAFVYFFKYRKKVGDKTWKIATVGLVPLSGTPFESDDEDDDSYSIDDDVTVNKSFTTLSEIKLEDDEPVRDQLQKIIRKMQFAQRNSAARFYMPDRRGFDFSNF